MVYIDCFQNITINSSDVDLRTLLHPDAQVIDFDDLIIYPASEYEKSIRVHDVLNARLRHKYETTYDVGFTFSPEKIKLVRLCNSDNYLFFSGSYTYYYMYKDGFIYDGFMAIVGGNSGGYDILLDVLNITDKNGKTRRPAMFSSYFINKKPEKAMSLSTFKRSFLLK